jgi:hypothetical protein
MATEACPLPTTATEPEPGVEGRGAGIFTTPTGRAGAGATMVEAINAALAEEMERDARVVVLGEDVGQKGGVFGATKGLLDRFGARRVIDTPIAESGFTGFGAGLAMGGLIAVVEIQFMDFIMSALDQIFTDIAKMYYRTNGDVNLPMVIRTPVGGWRLAEGPFPSRLRPPGCRPPFSMPRGRGLRRRSARGRGEMRARAAR